MRNFRPKVTTKVKGTYRIKITRAIEVYIMHIDTPRSYKDTVHMFTGR